MDDAEELVILNLYRDADVTNVMLARSVEARALDVFLRSPSSTRTFRVLGVESSTTFSLPSSHGYRVGYRNLSEEDESEAQALVDAALRSGVIEVRGH